MREFRLVCVFAPLYVCSCEFDELGSCFIGLHSLQLGSFRTSRREGLDPEANIIALIPDYAITEQFSAWESCSQ